MSIERISDWKRVSRWFPFLERCSVEVYGDHRMYLDRFDYCYRWVWPYRLRLEN